jgi:hypothetical protein
MNENKSSTNTVQLILIFIAGGLLMCITLMTILLIINKKPAPAVIQDTAAPTAIVRQIQWATSTPVFDIVQAEEKKSYLLQVLSYQKELQVAYEDFARLQSMAGDDTSLLDDNNWRQQFFADLDTIVRCSKSSSEIQAPAGYEGLQKTYLDIYRDATQISYYMKTGIENHDLEAYKTSFSYIIDMNALTIKVTQQIKMLK